MRNNDPIIYNEDHVGSLKRQRDQNYNDSISILQSQWAQADIDQRMVLGDQTIWSQVHPVIGKQRSNINFNLMNNTIQMISGYQRRNRKSTVCIPIRTGMEKTSDQFTKCLYHIHNQTHTYQTYSDSFEQGALTQGVGLIAIYNDLSEDPISGDIKVRYIDFKSMIIDPFFRKPDLSDCRYIWTRKFFSREELIALYPMIANKVDLMREGRYTDDKFYFMPEASQIDFKNTFSFDEYWYLSTREATYLLDTETQEYQEVEGNEEDLKQAMFIHGERIRLIKKPKMTVRRSIWINDEFIEDTAHPDGLDCYPFVINLAYFSPDTPYYDYKYKGIIRDMRDAQYLFNRRKVADLDMIESQQQGLKIKKGALVKPDDAFNVGNGRALFIDKHASMDDVQPMPIIPPAPALLQMEEMLRDTMMRISGVNEELLGSAQDEKAGILSMLRQGAGLTTLQRLFDQFDETQKQIGDIMIKMIQKNWTYKKVQEVIGEDPTPEFRDKAFFQYGAKVVQGVLTESQQQLEFQQLLHLYDLTDRKDRAILNRAIEVSTIQNKTELLEKMQADAEALQQREMKSEEMQQRQMQVDIETKLAYAESQKGLAAERLAKISTDRAVAEDKLSRAEQEDTASLLNLVKTLKELKSFDQNELLAKVNTLHRINEIEFDKKAEIREGDIRQGKPPTF